MSAQLIVRAPLNTPKEAIDKLVRHKQVWINSKMQLIKRQSEIHSEKKIIDGEGFLFLGKWLKLSLRSDIAEACLQSNELLIPKVEASTASKMIESWYKEQAKMILKNRVEWFVNCYSFSYRRILITNAKSRWGSCGETGTLNFSWRLITAPMEIIDYVVIHELCHTIEKNHSEQFWIKVRTVFPNYKKAIKWLEENQRLMEI